MIFRALANSSQTFNQSKDKTPKSFCPTTFYHDILAYVLWPENQGVTLGEVPRYRITITLLSLPFYLVQSFLVVS